MADRTKKELLEREKELLKEVMQLGEKIDEKKQNLITAQLKIDDLTEELDGVKRLNRRLEMQNADLMVSLKDLEGECLKLQAVENFAFRIITEALLS